MRKLSQRILIRRGRKWAPGFKAGMDRLTLLFCANVFRFMIKNVLIYKTTNPQVLKGKDKLQLPVSFCKARKTRQVTSFSWLGSIDAFGSTLQERSVLNFFFFKFWIRSLATQNPGHPEPHELNTKGVYLSPEHNISNSAPRSGGVRIFKAHYTW